MKSIIKESDFQEWLRQLAGLYGYCYYHTFRAQHSPAGFPDTVMYRLEPEPRLIFLELKTDDLSVSQPTEEQYTWLYGLQHICKHVESYLCRPSDRDWMEEILK